MRSEDMGKQLALNPSSKEGFDLYGDGCWRSSLRNKKINFNLMLKGHKKAKAGNQKLSQPNHNLNLTQLVY